MRIAVAATLLVVLLAGCASPVVQEGGVPDATSATASTSPPRSPTAPPTAPLATTTFTSVRSPVSRGGTGQVTVRTNAGASCSITVTYSSGPS